MSEGCRPRAAEVRSRPRSGSRDAAGGGRDRCCGLLVEALAGRRQGDRRGSHRLRHFLLTWLKTQGIANALIQPYSGHESRQSLEIYARIALADAQPALVDAHGRHVSLRVSPLFSPHAGSPRTLWVRAEVNPRNRFPTRRGNRGRLPTLLCPPHQWALTSGYAYGRHSLGDGRRYFGVTAGTKAATIPGPVSQAAEGRRAPSPRAKSAVTPCQRRQGRHRRGVGG